MGFLKKLGDAGKKLTLMSEGLDPELMENGLLGLGTIVALEEKHLTVRIGGGDEDDRTCDFTVQVALDNTEPYTTTCTQRVSSAGFDALQPGRGFVAVRVNPDDHSQIALDTRVEPPIVTLPAAGPGDLTTVDILAKGVAARVTVEASAFLRLRNAQGVDMHTIKGAVTLDGQAPYVTQFSNPVPAEGGDLLKPGADLPAKALAENAQAVAIDWAAAKAGS